jgi:proteasome accessory factor B
MTEESPLVRQWILLRTLCSRRYGATVKEMAEEMGGSEKTIRRDLETFQKSGFPLAEIVEDHGRKKWRVEPGKNQPGLTFTLDEAISLHLGRHLLEPLAGTPFWEAAQRAFRKIRSVLGTPALKYVEKFSGMFHQTMVGVSDYAKKADIIDELMLGIEDAKAVFITYQSLRATEPVTYDIYPYGLTYHRGSLYLVGRAPAHEEIRHWKVDRIEDAEVTKVPFNRPKDFDLHEHLAKSFGVFHGTGEFHVKVWFSPTVARYVSESKWHSSQQLTPQKDGSLVAEFDLDHTEEIKRWLLSFGKHASVLEPPQLRQDIAAELTAMLEKYTHAERSMAEEEEL